jgi:hypothetical protein
MVGKSGGLTQRRFAELLREAQKKSRVTNIELGKRTGTDETTISRYRRFDYPSGPPSPAKRRQMERVMGIVEGFLDGHIAYAMAPARPSETRNGANPTRPRGHIVTAGSAISLESRPPTGERARKILELRLELFVAEGRTPTQEELRELWQLALWATQEGEAGAGGG